MTQRSMWVAAALAVMGTLPLIGCQSDPDDGTATPVPTTQVAPMTQPAPTTDAPSTEDAVTTTSPPELSPEEQDQADIEMTLQSYNAALGRAVVGEESIEGIYPFSRDAAREQWITQVMSYEAQGITFSGVSQLHVLQVSVDGDTAEAVACADVSEVEAVDADGDSFITEDRLEQTLNDFGLERDDSAEFGWYVVEDINRDEPCEG